MGTNPDQMVRAALVRVWLAVVGSPVPNGLTTPVGPWFDVGLTTPDSLKFSVEPEFTSVNSHQEDYPTMEIEEKISGGLDVDLQQWNGDNFKAVYGGGTIAAIAGTPNLYRFSPPRIGQRTPVAALLDVFSGTKQYRLIVPRVLNKSAVALELAKSPEAKLPLRLSILGAGGDVDPWYVVTNDSAFAPAS